MDSSDDDKSKGSDSPIDHGSSTILREEDRPGRVLLRPWLENMLEMGTIEGLQWIDTDKTMFKVPWKHRSKKDWSTRHSSVFLEWAKNTGRWTKGDPTPNYAQLKTRLRCAFNKAPDIEEMKGHHFQQGEEPYKVYRFKSRKECWAMKQNNLMARNAVRNQKITMIGRGNNNNSSVQWGIKKERLEEELLPHVDGQEVHYYSNGNQEQNILSFKENDEDMKGEIKGESEMTDVDGMSVNQGESKFIPSVIPLTVEMFSSSISDESDAENEGSKRLKGHRGRPNSSRSQKQQDVEHFPLKPQNDFASYHPHNSISTSIHTSAPSGKLNDERGNLDFFQVASLFVEASEILQKDAGLKGQSETARPIKQEIPDSVTSEEQSEESNSNAIEPGRGKQQIIIESPVILNALPKIQATNYPANLPKLDLHYKSSNKLGADLKVGNPLFQQLSKIRLNSSNLIPQVGISKPKLRFTPPSGVPSISHAVAPLTISRPNLTTPSKFLIFSNSQFLSNFSSPVFSIPRPSHPENMKIVLGKIQSPPVLKDSGLGSQSIPSLIMLSSAAEAAESATLQQGSTSLSISLSNTINNVSPLREVGIAVAENKSAKNQNTSVAQDTIVTTLVDKDGDDDDDDIVERMSDDSAVIESETSGDRESLPSSSDSQEEALDLSSAAMKNNEPQDTSTNEQSIQDDLSDKLEIDESSPISNIKEDNNGCKRIAADDNSGLDIASRLSEAGSMLREVEESTSPDSKFSRTLRNVLYMLKTCHTQLNQKQKSLKSQEDILHLRTRLVESEEEKMQLKAQCLRISEKKDDPSLVEAKYPEFSIKSKDSVAGVVPAATILNKSGAPHNACLPQRTILSFSSSNSIKATVAPSQPIIPIALTGASKSPKPIRVINFSKLSEPCGVVHPMQHVQPPRPTTPVFSFVNGFRSGCAPRSFGDLSGVSPSPSPSSSPIIVNIQNPLANMKVLKINRTPSTEGVALSSIPVATARCPPTIITPPLKSKSSETRMDDEIIGIKNSDLQDAMVATQKHKQRDSLTTSEKELPMAKRFRTDKRNSSAGQDQTVKSYEEFKLKHKYTNINLP